MVGCLIAEQEIKLIRIIFMLFCLVLNYMIIIYILPEGKRFRYDFRQRMKQWLAHEGQGQEVHTFEEHRGLSVRKKGEQ